MIGGPLIYDMELVCSFEVMANGLPAQRILSFSYFVINSNGAGHIGIELGVRMEILLRCDERFASFWLEITQFNSLIMHILLIKSV